MPPWTLKADYRYRGEGVKACRAGLPAGLPGGEAVLFTILTGDVETAQIAVLNLETGDQTVLIRGGSFPRYSSRR